jgi:3-oxoacyl-[acyl-carrier-protein] synthase II
VLARRVVVTGVGAVSPAGVGVDALWKLLVQPTDGPVVRRLEDFDPSPWFTKKDLRRSDRVQHLAVVAAALAVDEAGELDVDPVRAGVVLGNVYGALGSVEAQLAAFQADGPSAVSPFLGAIASESSCVGSAAQHLGFRGPCKMVGGGCASGAFAVGDAADLIAAGRADVVVAGAAQGPLIDVIDASFTNLKVASPSGWVRPFDARREGSVFSEGSAALVLESLEHAEARGATVIAEVLGSANTNDASSLTDASGRGARECMQAAIDDAGLAPVDVVHVNTHGSGTIVNDTTETEALNDVLGRVVPITSVKGRLGHAAGAAGALEVVATVESIRRRTIPPVAAELQQDPEITAEVVSGEPRDWEPGPALSNSFGLGGHNGCVVLAPAT